MMMLTMKDSDDKSTGGVPVWEETRLIIIGG